MPESNILNNPKPDPRYRIEVIDHAGDNSFEAKIAAAVQSVLQGEDVPRAEISVALVDDPTIHRLNRDFLQHDWPTDVVTFPGDDPMSPAVAEDDSGTEAVFGEIIISVDTARRVAEEMELGELGEIVLYAIHGTLHLIGLDDHSESDQAEMRAAESKYMELAGMPGHSRKSDQVSGP
jgi:probable rRNA maturation factor